MGRLARRLLISSDADRKRLERALHDGAQQRLVAVATTLGLALRRLEAGEEGAAELVEEASGEARRCLEDLREFARDIYPAVLAERGLASALDDLARRAPGVVEVDVAEGRLPEAVELTAYLIASKALMSMREGAEVSLRALVAEDSLSIELHGVGLDDEHLERLRDRVEALNGSIEGGGETVRAVLPIGI